MGRHPIDMTTICRHPILTPHQFQMHGQLVVEVEFNKFYKAKLATKCTGPDTIFIFCENLRHVVGNFNILLRPLKEISHSTRTCALTTTNCSSYDNVKQTMSTAPYFKISSRDHFKLFPQAMAYACAAANTSNGFRFIFRVVELVHPQLRQAKGGIHKSIPILSYIDIKDDSFYTFLS